MGVCHGFVHWDLTCNLQAVQVFRAGPLSPLLWSVKCSICVLVVQQTQNNECVPVAGGNYSACVSVSDPRVHRNIE